MSLDPVCECVAVRLATARRTSVACVVASLLAGMWCASAEAGQQPATPPELHEHVAVSAVALTPTREASGTAWLPPSTPMYGLHRPWRGWDLRLDGAASGEFVYEPGERHRTGGADTQQFGSVNWAMAMGRRAVGKGRVGVRTMLSAEPWTIRGCGSLNLLATGEVCEHDTIHDRQQQHDLVMELAADYEHPLRRDWRWQVYGGVAGEPALGPSGYPHRASAAANPVAPVTHHWLDGSHITFGVITAGIHNDRVKAEASAFNGREPDESRVDLDLGAFDSFAARVSFLPTERLAVQVSGGRVNDARTVFLERSPRPAAKGTASATYVRPINANGTWATTLAAAVDRAHETVLGAPTEFNTSAFLAESSMDSGGRHAVFGRAELFAMPAHHLHANEFGGAVFTLAKVQLGYAHDFRTGKGFVAGIGGTASVSVLPRALGPRYGGRAAPGLALFLNVRPTRHVM
jgi:hypothetical protein